jgi:putative ABC transport system permease protein
MAILFKIFWQSLVLSFAEIRAAKLRSFLSLLGITIGILCIISVRTAVNSLEINVQNSLSSLGSDVIYIEKWPWLLGGDYPWWKFINRPVANRRELEQLKEKAKGADAVCMMYFGGNVNVLAGSQTAEGTQLMGTSYDYNKVKDLEFTQGRYFTPAECSNAQPVALIGASVAETLFEGRTQIVGEDIKINGVKMNVIGVLKKEGDDIFGFTLDNDVIVPATAMSSFINMNSLDNDPLLAVVHKPNVPVEELKYELRGDMRSIRRLSPYQDDNFAINQVSVFTQGISSIFGIINFAGLIIGGFSILVGTFGIANIMFVSVQERVYQIGIKKALGAKKIYILLEFLLEAVMLCVFGGLTGLVTVVLLFQVLQWAVTHNGSDFKFYVTAYNIFIGISISVITGIFAGFIPAWSAANMKPVDAIRGEVSDLFKGFMNVFKGKAAKTL